MRERCVIVGGGQAGGRIALLLREYRYDGEVVLLCAERVPPYERPPLSKAHLAEAGFELATIASEAAFRDRDIDLRLGADVESIDPGSRRVALRGGESLAFDRLVLATGATPRRLDIPGGGLTGIRELRNVDDATVISAALRPGARVVVIGGGFIGLEVAAGARSRGCDVRVIETAPRLMVRTTGSAVAEAAANAHRAAGVGIVLGARPARFAGTDRVEAVVLEDGREFAADLVVVGIGVVPSDGLARAAGLDCDDGVLVDARGRTSDSRIHAAGDVTRACGLRLESWHNAQVQAVAVARDIAGLEPAPAEPPWVWSDQGANQIQCVGVRGAGAEALMRGDARGAFAIFYLHGETLAGAETFDSALDAAYARRLAGKRVRVDRALLADPSVPLRHAMTAMA